MSKVGLVNTAWAIILPSLVSPFGLYPSLYPVTAGLANWSSQARAGGGASGDLLPLVVTGSLLSVIPLIAAFLMLQRNWQSGLTTGGVKQ